MSVPFKFCGKTLLLCACFLLFESQGLQAQETQQRRGLLSRVFNRDRDDDDNSSRRGWNPFRRNKDSDQPDVIKAPDESDVTVTSQGAPETTPPVPPPTRYTQPQATPQYVQQPSAPRPIPQQVSFQPIQKTPAQPAPQQPAYPQLFTQAPPQQPAQPVRPTLPPAQLPRSRPQAIVLPDNLLANAQPVPLAAVLTPLPGASVTPGTPATLNVSQTRRIPAVPKLQDFPDPFPEGSEKQADTTPVTPPTVPMQNLPIDLNSQQPVAEQKPVPMPEEQPFFQMVEPTVPSQLEIVGPIERPTEDVDIALAPAVEPEEKPTAQPELKTAEAKPAAEIKPEAKPAAEIKPVDKPAAEIKPAAKPEAEPAGKTEPTRAEQSPEKPKPTEPAAPESAAGQPVPGGSEYIPAAEPKTEPDGAAGAKRRLIAERAGMKGLKGFCPVALRDSRDLKDTNIAWSANYEGRTYFFSSEEALKQFETNPTKYAPAEKGIDIIMTLKEHRDVEGSLDNAVWYQDRLYLFSHRDSLIAFVREPQKFLDGYATPDSPAPEPEIVPYPTETAEPKRLDATDEYEATRLQPTPAATPATEPKPATETPAAEPKPATETPQPAQTPRRSGLGSGLGSILAPTRTAEKPAPAPQIETQLPIQPKQTPQPVKPPQPLELPPTVPKTPAQATPETTAPELNPFEQPQVEEPQTPAPTPPAATGPSKLPANPFATEAVKPEVEAKPEEATPEAEVKPAFEATPPANDNPFEDLTNPFEVPEQ